jgi:predicted TIM-barrel fold metal-dependent hydrolase
VSRDITLPSSGETNPYVPFADLALATPEDRYRPGLAFDPARARTLTQPEGPWRSGHLQLAGVTRSLDFVRQAVEHGGYVGVKIYPPAGYLPLGNDSGPFPQQGERLDAALRSLYAYCVAMDVPILAHANASNGFAEGYDDFAGPDGWRLVLEEFGDLRVCFGHFGHLHKVGEDAANPAEGAWVQGFVRLIDDYPNVYADVGNSKFPVLAEYRDRYLKLLGWMLGTHAPTQKQSDRRARVMFGTDWWMNAMSPAHDTYLLEFVQYFGAACGEAALEQFMRSNALRWLGFGDDPGRAGVENLNQQRLRAFYGSMTRPDWLT